MTRKTETKGLQEGKGGHESGPSGFTRRSFLARAGATTGAAATAQVWLSGVTRGGSSSSRPTLVIVNQRGGADGLSICAPVNDPIYTGPNGRKAATLITPPSDPMDRRWLELDVFAMGKGGENPNQNDWLKPYHAGHLGFVHGVGLEGQSRSHFAAMAAMEQGIDPGAMNVGTGWAGRHLSGTPSLGSLVRGFGHGNLLAQVLAGGPQTSAIADVSNLTLPVPGPYANQAAQDTIVLAQNVVNEVSYIGGVVSGVTYAGTDRQAAKDAAQASFDTISLFGSIDFDSASPVPYPNTPFGKAMRNTAKIIKDPNLSVEVIHLELGSWDHHTNMNPLTSGGRMFDLTKELSDAIGAFYEELGGTSANHDEYVMMVYTEFGRQTKENETEGVDHGTGSVMTLMGKGVPPGVNGGIGGTVFRLGDQNSVFGPSVSDAVETRLEYRDAVAEVLVKQCQYPAAALDVLFPSSTYMPAFQGLVSD